MKGSDGGEMTGESDGIWLETDEVEELISSIEHSAALAATLDSSEMQWKWLIIALHNAVQGACVCALRGHDTSGIAVLSRSSGKKVWEWLDVTRLENPDASMPAERLASMMDLYERVGPGGYLPVPHGLRQDSVRDEDVGQLNALRNDFIHFVPKRLSLEVSSMPRIVSHCCDVIEHLALREPTFWHRLNHGLRDRMANALAQLRTHMTDWTSGQGL